MRELKVENSALVVVDMQRYFLESRFEGYIPGAKKIIPFVNNAVLEFRKRFLPVIFTRHAHRSGAPLGQMGKWWKNSLPWVDSPEAELSPEISCNGDLVITKSKYSAFEDTDLGEIFAKRNVKTVFICGVMTHICVETTARHAFLLDFQPVILKNACASKNKIHHFAALYNLRHAFAFLQNTKDLKDIL